MVLRSCVELVKHSLGIASTPVEESNIYLSSSHAHVIISGLTMIDRYLIPFVYF